MAIFKEESIEILSENGKRIAQRKYNSSFGDMHRFYRAGKVFEYKFLFSDFSYENLSEIFSFIFSTDINYKMAFVGEEVEFVSNKMTKESVKKGKISYKGDFGRSKGLTLVVEGRTTINYTTVQLKKRVWSKKIKMVYRESKINNDALEKYSPRGRAEFVLWKRNFKKRAASTDDNLDKVLTKIAKDTPQR